MTESKSQELLGKSVDTKVEVEPKDIRQEKAKEVFAQAREILKEHGNQESNIPITNIYWQLMNEFRSLSRPTP